MRIFSLVLTGLLFHLGLYAQKEVTVLHVSGQVLYYAGFGSKAVSLYPGFEMDLKGKVRCKGTGSAKLLYNGNTFLLTGTKMRDVQEVVKAKGGSGQLGFTGRFLNFVTESVKEGENTEKLEKHHRRYMTKTSGGIKGWAKPDYTIKPLLLTTGKLPSANVIFKWRNTPGEGPYTFTLLSALGKEIARIQVRDTSVMLDLDQLAMQLEEEYEWSVSRGEKAKSASIPFEVCPANQSGKVSDYSGESEYKSADPTERQLMLAFALEEDHCFYSANDAYLQLMNVQPDNVLIRKLYATFLARMDMLPEANSLLNKSPK